MLTRCDDCQTLFRVTREQLNAARGQVRCGRCGNVFDALASLQEELPLHAADVHRALDEEEPLAPGHHVDETFDGAFHEEEPSSDEPLEEPPARVDETRPQPPIFLPAEGMARASRTGWAWVLFVWVLIAALAVQLVHWNRVTLADHPRIGPYLSMAYDVIGWPLETRVPHDLGAFALRHHELVSHPREVGALHLSGVLHNGASFPQPWPLIELRLEDRFGDVVAARRLRVAEYLRDAANAGAAIPAGARRAIEIELVDPGADAVGFSIDFCLEVQGTLRCGNQNER